MTSEAPATAPLPASLVPVSRLRPFRSGWMPADRLLLCEEPPRRRGGRPRPAWYVAEGAGVSDAAWHRGRAAALVASGRMAWVHCSSDEYGTERLAVVVPPSAELDRTLHSAPPAGARRVAMLNTHGFWLERQIDRLRHRENPEPIPADIARRWTALETSLGLRSPGRSLG